jgi:hypothetical protein
MHIRLCITIAILLTFLLSQAQDTSIVQLPSRYLDQVSTQTHKIEQKLDKQSTTALLRLKKQEVRMKAKLARIDSVKAKELFGDIEQKYKALEQKLNNPTSAKQYIPSLDSLSTSLKFLQQNTQLISGIKGGQEKLKQALSKVGGLERQFQKAEEIKKFLKERQQFLKVQLSRFGFAKELKKLNKQAYYYSEQLNEYKALLKDHKKAEKKALEILSKTKLFKDFFRKNSMLASLFRMPGDPNDLTAQANLAGLQTRAQVNSLIQQQVIAGGPNAQAQFKQNMQEAQSQLQQLKNKIMKHGSSNSDDIMPEGFKANSQKTKKFWDRLEYGTNIQTQKGNGFFPVTSDLGISVGYKLNNKSIIGIGTSYKMGWGQSFRNIKISQQGIGIRSFVDYKLKSSFWLSGGFEMNYKTAFNSITQLKEFNAWQQSGLIGLTKTVSIRSKFFKKTKLQLLWDFLSYQQVPKTPQINFRIGYNF